MKTTELKKNGNLNRVAEHQKNGNMEVEAIALDARRLTLQLRGLSPYICNAFSAITVEAIEGKQTGKGSAGRKSKDILACALGSVNMIGKNQVGIKAISFKVAAVSSSNDVELVQTEMRRAFHIEGELIPIKSAPLPEERFSRYDTEFAAELEAMHAIGASMRCDPVRNATGVIDLRYRMFFPEWSVEIPVSYNGSMVTPEQLVALFTAAGFGAGVGDWRPGSPKSKGGTYGRFQVV